MLVYDDGGQMPETMKRRVVMTSHAVSTDASGHSVLATHQAVDYVLLEELDAYVEDARTRWQHVEVGDVDAGPGGVEGQTVLMDGTVREAE